MALADDKPLALAPPSTRTIALSLCQPADMPRACAIHFDTMSREHTVVDEQFPYHWTTAGRRAALQRHCDPSFLQADPSYRHMKIVDSSLAGVSPDELGTASCDPFIGYGRWQVKYSGEPAPNPISQDDGINWWATDRNKRFVQWQETEYNRLRYTKLHDTPLDRSLYCVTMLAILPGFQGRGAGTAFMKWGMDQADRDGAECTVESALSAVDFYTKHGFEAREHVKLTPPPEFAEKGTQEYIWMVRKPRAL